jgi:ParB-like chromosome segregation protein Spo0J
MTAETITPVAIDAYVSVDEIDIVDRHRRDLGDLDALGRSIVDVGLINPITLTRTNRLVAGQRRMEACRLIGMDTVPVRYVDNLTDAAALLRAERDENVCRKDMTASELYAVGKGLEDLERPSARARQGERNDLATSGSQEPEVATNPTARAVADGLGTSSTTWKRLKHIGDRAADGDPAAAETLQRIDSGQETITGGYQKIRTDEPQPASPPEPEPAPDNGRGPGWIPAPNERDREAAARRRELIREMAPTGATSQQIGDKLGILPQTIRKIARDQTITITADVALGRSHKTIDSNRIVREIVQDLDNTEASIKLIRFDELDAAQIEHWTTSLSKSIRMLNRLNQQLRKAVQ